MYKYLNLLRRFASASISAKMIYKANFLTEILVEIGWAMVTIFTFELIFANVDTMAGWTKMEAFFIYGLFRLVSAIFAILFRANLFALTDLVNRGDLDLILTKPVPALFYLSFHTISVERFSQLIIAIIILVYVNFQMGLSWSLFQILLFVYLVSLAVLLRYSFSMLIHLLVFWSEKLDNLFRLELSFTATARFPRQAMPWMLRQIMTFVIPMMFVAAIPAEILLEKSPAWFLITQMTIFVLGLFGLVILVSRKAIANYSSASS